MCEIVELASLIYPYTKQILSAPQSIKNNATDICISIGAYPRLYTNEKFYELSDCKITDTATMNELVYTLCDYSVYKHVEEIKNGYISLKGKYRVGVCGTAVLSGNGIENIKNISSINIRIARNIKGSADELISKIPSVLNGVLIVGEPSCGKTTILKDLISKLSYKRLVVLDERFELSTKENKGKANILCAYPKKEGINHAIRNLGAQIIICDELEERDLESVKSCANSGVSLIATVHADLFTGERELVKQLIKTGAFKYIAQLEGRENPCKVKKIWRAGDFSENSRTNTYNNGSLIHWSV